MYQSHLVKLLAWRHAVAVDGLHNSTALYRNATDRFEVVWTYPDAPWEDFAEELSSEDASEFLVDPDTVLVAPNLEAWQPTGQAS